MNDAPLSEEELELRFHRLIRPELIEQAQGSASWDARKPVIVFTGGQPGAGKSRANARIKYQRPSTVEIIGDDLRQYHPDYSRLMAEDPLSMPDRTAQASGRWVGMAADYAREQRMDVLLETTLRQVDVVAATMSAFKQAGYRVEFHVLAVAEEVSRLGTISRYVGQIQDHGAGRWTPAAAHDVASAAVPETMQELIDRGLVDKFVLLSRSGAELSVQDRRDVTTLSGIEAREALTHHRNVSHIGRLGAQRWLEEAERALRVCRTTGRPN